MPWVPNFPDPSTGPVGEQVIDLRRTGIDLSSPTFKAAREACQKIVPGGGSKVGRHLEEPKGEGLGSGGLPELG